MNICLIQQGVVVHMAQRTSKYLRNEDGDVTLCTRNIAKMNVFEWIWYGRELILDAFLDAIAAVCKGVFALIVLLVFPILIIANAYIEVRDNKREMNEMIIK